METNSDKAAIHQSWGVAMTKSSGYQQVLVEHIKSYSAHRGVCCTSFALADLDEESPTIYCRLVHFHDFGAWPLPGIALLQSKTSWLENHHSQQARFSSWVRSSGGMSIVNIPLKSSVNPFDCDRKLFGTWGSNPWVTELQDLCTWVPP